MIDVGGAEGIFTREMLSQCKVLPATIWLVEPSEQSASSYQNLISQSYPSIQIESQVEFIENVITNMPEVDLVVASHSLYSVLDRDEEHENAANLILNLAQKARGFCYISMASKDSPAYDIKRRILALLKLNDVSSFGEDMKELIPRGYNRYQMYKESLINVTDILKSDEELLAWLGYFCRIDPGRLREHIGYCRRLIQSSAIEFSRLPLPTTQRYGNNNLTKKLCLNPDSLVLLHKELLVQTYKKNIPIIGKV